jgi:4-alpha-glucanotransferase
MDATPSTPESRPRAAGVLLHPTSLPSPHGIGDLGTGARTFIDWLHHAGLTRWQILPLVPPGPGFSPYATVSSFASNLLLIDLRTLAGWGLLDERELGQPRFSPDFVDVEAVEQFKWPFLERAADRFARNPDHPALAALHAAYRAFVARADWLDDVATFLAIRQDREGLPWWDWCEGLKTRDPQAIAAERERLAGPIERLCILHFMFEQQWSELHAYARARGIRIIGDVPIYVDLDSADVWCHRDLFELDADGRPARVAGVPPDFFSKTGQRWGNPLFDWERLAATGHAFWVRRLRRMFDLVDIVRLDHFRGFSAYWAVPADAPDARDGAWVKGPGRALFDDLQQALGPLELIAEDLGLIDADVEILRDALGLPGMRILQFAFGASSQHPFLPHNHAQRAVAYTATHDNDTTLGWWQSAPELVRDHVRRYFAVNGHDIVWDMIRAAFSSVAELAMVPMQDVLCLDSGSRMNTPGTSEGNWRWRVRAEAFNAPLAHRLRGLAALYGRLPLPSRTTTLPAEA